MKDSQLQATKFYCANCRDHKLWEYRQITPSGRVICKSCSDNAKANIARSSKVRL